MMHYLYKLSSVHYVTQPEQHVWETGRRQELVYYSGPKCRSTVGLRRSHNTTADRFQTHHQLSVQPKCNKLPLLSSAQNTQQGRIHPAAEDLIEMQDAAFGAVPC